jgi:flagellum-specific ATP synthase
MFSLKVDTAQLIDKLKSINPVTVSGRVTELIGLVMEAEGVEASVGELCTITCQRGGEQFMAEVVGFTRGHVLLMPFHSSQGVQAGDRVRPSGGALRVPVGETLLGRVANLTASGRPTACRPGRWREDESGRSWSPGSRPSTAA